MGLIKCILLGWPNFLCHKLIDYFMYLIFMASSLPLGVLVYGNYYVWAFKHSWPNVWTKFFWDEILT